MARKLTYADLLESNSFLRNLSDTTYWLCITRTTQESKLFPMNPYMLLSYLNSFYRLPTLLREVDSVMPAEELGDRVREASFKVNTVNAAWGMPTFYLLGRELLLNWGLIRPQDAIEDVVDVLDFSRRFNLSYHRNDGHITNKEFGDRSQFLPERTLDGFREQLLGVTPNDRLHTAAVKLLAQLSQYAFLAHCECRIGIHNSGPYNWGDNRQMLVRDFFDLTEGDYPWLDGIATRLPHNNLTIPIVFKDTHFHLVDDWASFEAEPSYDARNIVAVGMYTSDPLTDGYVPVGMENAEVLAETMEEYREILAEATADLWKRIASWSREQMIDAGALVYSSVAKDFAHLTGTYRQSDWMELDDRAQRFKVLMNDEYARDNLTEMVGLLGFPQQKANPYTMARYSNLNQHMISGLPYSVLNDDDYAPTVGSELSGRSSLDAKTGLWTTSAGRITIDEYNERARGFTPTVHQEKFRYLDEEWVKWNHDSELAAELYRLGRPQAPGKVNQ
ncbi:hypothetical protein [Mycolicibacterium thermoresistibile]|uniref:Uncharacterized protein n=2 Tax=Mycolicibacterium thermoresistibile TaxID=1797 RepID=G7CH68_MYCT3|nr:hypothetical protein [Mycolicibacterium thermoresistibile]EHI12178.1 hypothetical protein KEK_14803 [Mycolicibacterium thermoresistibile ATCC 19527]MCV7191107.1 hypothetical protein [Mycolicibacterium thermoresistibile]GAT15545.1 putative uncharacterized protein [Mycolicibacterium thermoresistibile]SNW16904.1 Uncharacterised protein [Mycolicibacterium thermoresistibile]